MVRFHPALPNQSRVAELVQRWTDNPEIEGSIPSPATKREIAMLLFIKNFLSGLKETADEFMGRYGTYILLGMFAIVLMVLLFGCAGSQVTKQPLIEGPGYCKWEEAPSWLAKDFIADPAKWGVIDGYQFIGKHGLPCYALKIDAPPADGTCDAIGVICESGVFDDRHGPNTPLVQGLGRVPCHEWDGLIESIKKDQQAANR